MVVPDCHVTPGVPNDRILWAGRMALDLRPDVIINLGDFADMEALCSYDRGKKDFEGRRYKSDIAHTREALKLFNQPIDEYNASRISNKKAQYKPRKIMLGGNHEYRIVRATQVQPELEGTIELENLGYEEYGWEVIPYEQPIEVDQIYYSHFFPSGVKGEAISGYNLASNLLAKHHVSCTVGHSHIADYAVRALPNGKKIHGLSAGCYLDHDPKFALNTSHLWWRGIVMKYDVEDGDYDISFYSIERIKRLYENG